MTDLLTRAANWLIAPPDDPPAEEEPAPATASSLEPLDDPSIDDERAATTTRWLQPSPPARHNGARRRKRPSSTPARSPDVAPLTFAPSAARTEARIEAVGMVAVLGAREDVVALAASIALALRRRAHAAAAVVLVHASQAGAAPLGPHGFPGARLLGARLSRRGFETRARGRLVWLHTAAGDDPGVVARRLEAAAGRAPCVLAITAPRDAHVDSLLADCALVVLAAEPDSALAGPALAELAALGVRARAISAPPDGFPRMAALAGLRAHADAIEVVA